MKRLFPFLIVLFVLLSGCSSESDNQDNTSLTGKDLVAYNIMLDVCNIADDPTSTYIVSGTVVDGDAGGSIMVKSGNQVSYVLVSYENGKAVCEDGKDVANYSSAYMDMFRATNCFDTNTVNQALKEYWGIEN
jgi:hypothetical protein